MRKERGIQGCEGEAVPRGMHEGRHTGLCVREYIGL